MVQRETQGTLKVNNLSRLWWDKKMWGWKQDEKVAIKLALKIEEGRHNPRNRGNL